MNSLNVLYATTAAGLMIPRHLAASEESAPSLQRDNPFVISPRRMRRFIAERGGKNRCQTDRGGAPCGRVISQNKTQCARCADEAKSVVARMAAVGLVTP